jgi:hypothetical protein
MHVSMVAHMLQHHELQATHAMVASPAVAVDDAEGAACDDAGATTDFLILP